MTKYQEKIFTNPNLGCIRSFEALPDKTREKYKCIHSFSSPYPYQDHGNKIQEVNNSIDPTNCPIQD